MFSWMILPTDYPDAFELRIENKIIATVTKENASSLRSVFCDVDENFDDLQEKLKDAEKEIKQLTETLDQA